MTSVRSPPSPRVPVSSRALAVVGAAARTSRSSRAAARAAPSQSGAAALTAPYPTKVPVTDRRPRAARGGHPRGRPAARPRRRRARARRARSSSASPWLVEQGTPPDAILVADRSRRAAADALRERIEDALGAGALRGADGHDVPRRSARGCCARRRSRPASTRSSRRVTAADRLALLLERIDELPLRSHDLRGNPSALLGSVVAADRPAQGRAGHRRRLRRVGRRRCPRTASRAGARGREREFAALYAAHDRHARRGGDARPGDLVLHAFGLLREQAARPRARSRALPRTCSSTSSRTRLRPNLLLRLLVAEHGNVTVAGDDDQAIARFRGASTKNLADFRARVAGRRASCA